MNGLFCEMSCQEPFTNGSEFDIKYNGIHVKVINNAHDGNLGILEITANEFSAIEDFLRFVRYCNWTTILGGGSPRLTVDEKEYHRLTSALCYKIYQTEEGQDSVYCVKFVSASSRELYAVYLLINRIYIHRLFH